MPNDPNRADQPGVGSGNGKNLQKWKPGQSGNPKGRPKAGESLTELLYNYGEKFVENSNKIKYKEAFIRKLWYNAIRRDESTISKYVFDRLEGKPAESVVIENKNTETVSLEDLPHELKKQYLLEELKKLEEKK